MNLLGLGYRPEKNGREMRAQTSPKDAALTAMFGRLPTDFDQQNIVSAGIGYSLLLSINKDVVHQLI